MIRPSTPRSNPLVLVLVLVLASSVGCDRFDPPPAEASTAERDAARARASARAPLTAVMSAAQAAVKSCVAGDLHWEPDFDGNDVPRHFSRPCILERCSPSPAEIEALRSSTRAARALVDGNPHLRVPSFLGFVALAEAMVSFADTAIAGAANGKPPRLSGLSMHHGALAAAFRELYADAKVPLEPESLTTSLAAPGAGGDPCKGWARPQNCDVRGVRVPAERRWRADPPCIEVEGIPK